MMPAQYEPDADEIAEIEARKAELRAAKAGQDRGGPVLSKKYSRADRPEEPSKSSDVARLAIKEFRRVSGGKGDTRPHDGKVLVRIAAEHPDASQPQLAELYREATGRTISGGTIGKFLGEAGLPTERGKRGRPRLASRLTSPGVAESIPEPSRASLAEVPESTPATESPSATPLSRHGPRPAAKFLGVSPDGADPKLPYRAVLGLGGKKTRWLGRFATAQEAAMAWDDAAFAEFGAETRLNFPGREPRPMSETIAVRVEGPMARPEPKPLPAPEKPWQRQVNAVYAICGVLETLQPKEREWVVIQACFMFGFAFDESLIEDNAAFGTEKRKEGLT